MIFVCRYDWIKQIFVQHADHFSSRPIHSWLVNLVLRGKVKTLLINIFSVVVPPMIFVCRYDWIKQLFVQQADHFSSRPIHSWLVNLVLRCKGKHYQAWATISPWMGGCDNVFDEKKWKK